MVSLYLRSNSQNEVGQSVLLLDNYPFAPPYAYAVTLMWHPNIDSSIPPGKLNICLDLISADSSPRRKRQHHRAIRLDSCARMGAFSHRSNLVFQPIALLLPLDSWSLD